MAFPPSSTRRSQSCSRGSASTASNPLARRSSASASSNTNREPLELEVGAPVEGAVEGDERVRAGSLPAGRYLTLMHVGPYRSETVPDLAAARERLIAFAAEEGSSTAARQATA